MHLASIDAALLPWVPYALLGVVAVLALTRLLVRAACAVCPAPLSSSPALSAAAAAVVGVTLFTTLAAPTGAPVWVAALSLLAAATTAPTLRSAAWVAVAAVVAISAALHPLLARSVLVVVDYPSSASASAPVVGSDGAVLGPVGVGLYGGARVLLREEDEGPWPPAPLLLPAVLVFHDDVTISGDGTAAAASSSADPRNDASALIHVSAATFGAAATTAPKRRQPGKGEALPTEANASALIHSVLSLGRRTTLRGYRTPAAARAARIWLLEAGARLADSVVRCDAPPPHLWSVSRVTSPIAAAETAVGDDDDGAAAAAAYLPLSWLPAAPPCLVLNAAAVVSNVTLVVTDPSTGAALRTVHISPTLGGGRENDGGGVREEGPAATGTAPQTAITAVCGPHNTVTPQDLYWVSQDAADGGEAATHLTNGSSSNKTSAETPADGRGNTSEEEAHTDVIDATDGTRPPSDVDLLGTLPASLVLCVDFEQIYREGGAMDVLQTGLRVPAPFLQRVPYLLHARWLLPMQLFLTQETARLVAEAASGVSEVAWAWAVGACGCVAGGAREAALDLHAWAAERLWPTARRALAAAVESQRRFSLGVYCGEPPAGVAVVFDEVRSTPQGPPATTTVDNNSSSTGTGSGDGGVAERGGGRAGDNSSAGGASRHHIRASHEAPGPVQQPPPQQQQQQQQQQRRQWRPGGACHAATLPVTDAHSHTGAAAAAVTRPPVCRSAAYAAGVRLREATAGARRVLPLLGTALEVAVRWAARAARVLGRCLRAAWRAAVAVADRLYVVSRVRAAEAALLRWEWRALRGAAAALAGQAGAVAGAAWTLASAALAVVWTARGWYHRTGLSTQLTVTLVQTALLVSLLRKRVAAWEAELEEEEEERRRTGAGGVHSALNAVLGLAGVSTRRLQVLSSFASAHYQQTCTYVVRHGTLFLAVVGLSLLPFTSALRTFTLLYALPWASAQAFLHFFHEDDNGGPPPRWEVAAAFAVRAAAAVVTQSTGGTLLHRLLVNVLFVVAAFVAVLVAIWAWDATASSAASSSQIAHTVARVIADGLQDTPSAAAATTTPRRRRRPSAARDGSEDNAAGGAGSAARNGSFTTITATASDAQADKGEKNSSDTSNNITPTRRLDTPGKEEGTNC